MLPYFLFHHFHFLSCNQHTFPSFSKVMGSLSAQAVTGGREHLVTAPAERRWDRSRLSQSRPVLPISTLDLLSWIPFSLYIYIFIPIPFYSMRILFLFYDENRAYAFNKVKHENGRNHTWVNCLRNSKVILFCSEFQPRHMTKLCR